eukprot:5428676-Pyramimonas_sp.AAC.1
MRSTVETTSEQRRGEQRGGRLAWGRRIHWRWGCREQNTGEKWGEDGIGREGEERRGDRIGGTITNLTIRRS